MANNYISSHELGLGPSGAKQLIRYGYRSGTGIYSLFTRGNSSAQASGNVLIQAIYGTPSGAGLWWYVISGNRNVSLITSNTSIYSGSTPTLAWSLDTLQVSNNNIYVYYSVQVVLNNEGQDWNPTWGNLIGIS